MIWNRARRRRARVANQGVALRRRQGVPAGLPARRHGVSRLHRRQTAGRRACRGNGPASSGWRCRAQATFTWTKWRSSARRTRSRTSPCISRPTRSASRNGRSRTTRARPKWTGPRAPGKRWRSASGLAGESAPELARREVSATRQALQAKARRLPAGAVGPAAVPGSPPAPAAARVAQPAAARLRHAALHQARARQLQPHVRPVLRLVVQAGRRHLPAARFHDRFAQPSSASPTRSRSPAASCARRFPTTAQRSCSPGAATTRTSPARPNKLDKANVPEDAFYHLFEMNLDGSGVRQLTRGKYDDFDGRYLPDGRIVFLSTRRGQSLQAGRESAARTLAQPGPAGLLRALRRRPGAAGGGLHAAHDERGRQRTCAPSRPSRCSSGRRRSRTTARILYSRWDYIDRDNMPYMGLWAINPDGSNARMVYKNYTRAPALHLRGQAHPRLAQDHLHRQRAPRPDDGQPGVARPERRHWRAAPPITRLTPGSAVPGNRRLAA